VESFRLRPSPADASDAEISGLFRLIDNADSAHARNTDPLTSHAAAASLVDELPALEARVLQQLRWCGERGATSAELAELLDLPLVTVSPRLRPLADKGRIVATDERRRGESGRARIVWRAQS
jgi:hypothetical protein